MRDSYLINGHPGATLTPFDRGFAYGDGVFRTLPVLHGIPQGWARHYAKLAADCQALGIVCPSAGTLQGDMARLCAKDEDVALKIIITRGEGERGYAVPPLSQPNRIVLKSPLPDYPVSNFTEGVKLHLCQTRLALQPRLAGIKHLNRLENVLARMEWVDGQIADGVLLDAEGDVIECTMSNLFMRRGGVLLTPDLSRSGVAGITRQRIIESAESLGHTIEVGRFKLKDLLHADEVITCNSLYMAWQVRALGEKNWLPGTLAARCRALLTDEGTAPVR